MAISSVSLVAMTHACESSGSANRVGKSVHRRTDSERVDEVRQRLENKLVAPPAVGLSEQQIARRSIMSRFHRLGCGVALSAFAIAISTGSAVAQNQPNALPNPYRL